MKTPEQWAAEVPDYFIGREEDDRALFAGLFAAAMAEAREEERKRCVTLSAIGLEPALATARDHARRNTLEQVAAMLEKHALVAHAHGQAVSGSITRAEFFNASAIALREYAKDVLALSTADPEAKCATCKGERWVPAMGSAVKPCPECGDR